MHISDNPGVQTSRDCTKATWPSDHFSNKLPFCCKYTRQYKVLMYVYLLKDFQSCVHTPNRPYGHRTHRLLGVNPPEWQSLVHVGYDNDINAHLPSHKKCILVTYFTHFQAHGVYEICTPEQMYMVWVDVRQNCIKQAHELPYVCVTELKS